MGGLGAADCDRGDRHLGALGSRSPSSRRHSSASVTLALASAPRSVPTWSSPLAHRHAATPQPVARPPCRSTRPGTLRRPARPTPAPPGRPVPEPANAPRSANAATAAYHQRHNPRQRPSRRQRLGFLPTRQPVSLTLRRTPERLSARARIRAPRSIFRDDNEDQAHGAEDPDVTAWARREGKSRTPGRGGAKAQVDERPP
jgi:hypothetical protein